MKIKNQVTIERLIGKIDNDFNISESDWIPRVAAWVIDALSQMKCLPTERKRRSIEVANRIATFPCLLNTKNIRVFDANGCEISPLSANNQCGCTANQPTKNNAVIGIFDSTNKSGVNTVEIANIVNSTIGKNFVIDGNNIELNFDCDEIIVESEEVATYHDDYYDCDVPYIYDNGLLLEALSWYVLFKYLSRGSKHQVYSLNTNNQLLNPYIQWNMLKHKAARSAKAEIMKDTDGWRNFFYNSTFDPRR